MHQIHYLGQVSHMVQRRTGHDRVHLAGNVAVLELGLTVGGSLRRQGFTALPGDGAFGGRVRGRRDLVGRLRRPR